MNLLTKSEQEEFRNLDAIVDSRKVYDWAKSEGKLKEVDINYRLIFDIEKGQYLVLSQELFPQNQHEVGRWVELMEKEGVTGYCSCDRMGLDNSSPFVIERNVPGEFQDYVAIHEIFEGEVLPISISSYQDRMYNAAESGYPVKELGVKLTPSEIDAHRFACEVELNNVFLKGKEFSLKYVSWLPNDYFKNVGPNFMKKHKRKDMSPIELMVRFLRVITGSEKDWVERYSWLKQEIGSKIYK